MAARRGALVAALALAWLGWATPLTLSATTNQLCSLPAASGHNAVVRINASWSSEFFIIENRQHTGYDAGLPGSLGGLAIYHCDSTLLDDQHNVVCTEGPPQAGQSAS